MGSPINKAIICTERLTSIDVWHHRSVCLNNPVRPHLFQGDVQDVEMASKAPGQNRLDHI